LPVKMFNPPTLLIAYGLAKMQEEHVLSARRFRSPNLNFPNLSAQRFGGGHSSQQGVISQKLVIHVQKISKLKWRKEGRMGYVITMIPSGSLVTSVKPLSCF
jgi:hypothetical protein